MAQIHVSAIEAVIDGVEVTAPAQYVDLADSKSGYDRPGAYFINLSSSGRYVVSYGRPPDDMTGLLAIGRAVAMANGKVFFSGWPSADLPRAGAE